GAPRVFVRYITGNSIDAAALLERAASGDTGAAVLGRLDYENADGESPDDAGADGKILRKGGGTHREFGDQGAASNEDLLGETLVFLGINDIDTGAQRSHGRACCRDGSPMPGRVNTARQTAKDHQSPTRQITGEALRHAGVVRGRRVPMTAMPG